MVYRNGWKEFFITAIGFGAPMSLFFIIQYGFALGLAGGVLAGLLFGGATWQGLGGWLFLTEAGLEFYPHKFNHGKQNFAIPTEELVSVTVKRNIVSVALQNGGEVAVVVSHAKEWEAQIQAVIPPSTDDYAM